MNILLMWLMMLQVTPDVNKMYTFAQCQEIAKQTTIVDEWVVPEPKGDLHSQLCHKDFVRFWRLLVDGQTGPWYKYNKTDDHFLKDWAAKIRKGQYEGSKIQWFALEGKLPK